MSYRINPGTEDVTRRPASSPPPIANSSFPNVQLPASTDPPSVANPAKQAVWLIFGASGHMGRSVANAAISHGDKVCAVGRTLEDNLQSMQAWFPGREASYQALACDIRIRDSVDTVFSSALDYFGDIDIIVICHGYGLIGSCEDQDEYDIRNQFETNFMGTLNIIQTSLPHFREREAGRYVIFSSTSGALGVPGLGPYCATKYAVEGLVESMLYEVDQFNIKMTLVIAGHMRRDDHTLPASPTPLPSHLLNIHSPYPNSNLNHKDPSSFTAPAHTALGAKFQHFRIIRPSPPYSPPDSPSAHALRMLQWIGDNQPTSAVKAAELTWQLGHCAYPPLRLLLGTFAVESIRDRLKSIMEEIEDWKELHFPPIEGMEMEVVGEEDGEAEGEGEIGEGNGEVNRERDEHGDVDIVNRDLSSSKGTGVGEQKLHSNVGIDDKPARPFY